MRISPRVVRPAVIIVVLSVGIFGYWRHALSPQAKGKKLAEQHCASCHQFPDPGLLDKKTWEVAVLPQMAFRMGFKDNKILYGFGMQDLPTVRAVVPPAPMISEEEFELIRKYYLSEAPTDLDGGQHIITTQVKQFHAQPITSFQKAFINMLKYDSASSSLYAGTTHGGLFRLDKNFVAVDSITLKSPPTSLMVVDNEVIVSAVGRFFPSDQATGYLATTTSALDTVEVTIDSLKRPVYFARADFNTDGIEDFVVCAFGNYAGGLWLYVGDENGGFQKKVLSATPGARKVVVMDWNRDGITDIVAQFAQGDERISVFKGKGNVEFTEEVLIRFPPVYGSANFDVIDFNRDGHPDILTSNGDNGDYSNITKPYHGLRIFENNQKNELSEVWFFPMAGAWETRTADFDRDGDLDIAAISFFPDDKNYPKQNFVYFENTGYYEFTPQLEPLSLYGIWIVMESADFDRDGDVDIILGSCRFQDSEDSDRNGKGSEYIELLLLDNKAVQNAP